MNAVDTAQMMLIMAGNDIKTLRLMLDRDLVDDAPFESFADMSAFAVQFCYCVMGLDDVPLDRPDVLHRVVDLYNHLQSLPSLTIP